MPRFGEFERGIEKTEDDIERRNLGLKKKPVPNKYKPVSENERIQAAVREKLFRKRDEAMLDKIIGKGSEENKTV
jgi:hypothetical protein